MQYRRSRTDKPRASPFSVRSSIEITLPTVVYAGQQTALVTGALPATLILTYPAAILRFSSRRTRQRYNTIAAPPALDVIRFRYYLERQSNFFEAVRPVPPT